MIILSLGAHCTHAIMHCFLTVPRDAQEHCQAFIHLQDLSHPNIQVLSACVVLPHLMQHLNCQLQWNAWKHPGWQKMAAFRRGHNWLYKFSSNAYLLFLRQMRHFWRNCKFANFTQYSMQYIPCNSALIALFLTTTKNTVLPKDFQKVRKSRQILISHKIAYEQTFIYQGFIEN